ncbi:phage protease [Bradyrhizobium sp. 191]|uniref:phage protease n=1 Tax=Bradyrhizobium sp. 191 TaxID=2782659 RepID=UPI001FFFC36E|nr:phage protease [Bradyrhizobium sp. 191]
MFVALAHSQAPSLVRGVGVEIALNAEGNAAADWIMLVPIGAGGLVSTVDGRGPYRIADAGKLVAASLNAHGGRIPIDENHATDLAAPEGRPAPARGWITAMEVRADGIYGQPEWSSAGTALMSERAYRFISPVLIHDKNGVVLDLPRVSLTNLPNLRGMAALNSEGSDSMDLLAQLRQLLGLGDEADAGSVVAKVKDMCGTGTAMQSIAKAAGLNADATSETIITTVTTLATTGKDNGAATIAALQSEIKDLGGRLQTALTATATEKATAFIDNAIREGRVGVKPMREHYISRHAASPEGAAAVEKEIGALPKLGSNSTLTIEPPAKDGIPSLNAAQLESARLLGIKPEDYAKTLAAEAASA